MIIAITGFKTKNLLKKFRFLSHAVPLFQLAQKVLVIFMLRDLLIKAIIIPLPLGSRGMQ
tara:strand:- start:105 stop:284 length:180 start_codon:yes stop_codon:yes gene_type:complete